MNFPPKTNQRIDGKNTGAEFLIERKSCWMKDLVRELEMSKVMATRKVRVLVEKGLVKKEEFGREAKISLEDKKRI